MLERFDSNQNGPEFIKSLEKLGLPDAITVTSASVIKIDMVHKFLHRLFPDRHFTVTGIKTDSDVNEQPVEAETELGAKNRITNAERLIEKSAIPRAFISIENGIFKVSAGYEDKAVAVIKFPDGKVFSGISPRGVLFPAGTVERTLEKEGGFKNHTVGSTIAELFAEKGVLINKQDPHSALTNNVFTRENQMMSAIEKALEEAMKAQTESN